MTIGQGKQFKKVVVHLPIAQRNNCPGLEMVAISRAMTVADFAIGNKKVEVTKQALMKIGRTKAMGFLKQPPRKGISNPGTREIIDILLGS